MKNLKIYKAIIAITIMFCATTVIAQNNNQKQVPATVSTTFISKYPGAALKNWKVSNNQYTATAKQGGHKFYATFDEGGKWLKTVSKYNWPWKLSSVVRKAFYKSEYGAWHIYGVHIIETPAGEFYRILIDNTNLSADALHQSVITTNKTVEYKSSGELVNEKEAAETSML